MNFAILPRAILFVKRLFLFFSDFPVIFANLPPPRGTFIGKLAYITTPHSLCQANFSFFHPFFHIIFIADICTSTVDKGVPDPVIFLTDLY